MQQGKQQPQHQPADGPAFWNITHNFKPGELESDLSKMFFNQALDLHKENEALKQHIKRLEEALKDLLIAVTFADPPKEFNGVLCNEAMVPIGFVYSARAALGYKEAKP
jgi:hypothetical protein